MKIKRLFSIILCFAFLVSIFPVSAAAADDEPIDNPIKGLSDLITSYEFSPKTEVLMDVPLPKEDGEEEGTTSCRVSFTPIIEEGVTPFYIANGLHGETVFTIRNNDIRTRAAIKVEDIIIERSDLVKVEGEPRITLSIAEADYDLRGVDYYDIIFQVDFCATEDSGKKITLESRVPVYDAPFLCVEVDNDGQISKHYDQERYWAANIDGDIWNSTVQVNIQRENADDETEPVAGVPTRIFYHWGDSADPFCVFKPADIWVPTGADGRAEFITGNGGNPDDLIERYIGISAQALYGKLAGQNDDLSQYYNYPDLKDFEGTIKVKVQNKEKEPLEGRTVQLWGGAGYEEIGTGTTGADGIATITYPSSTTSEEEELLIMTELPTFELKWNITQVIDNPERIVEGHNAPLYLSPEVKVSDEYSENPQTPVSGVTLEVYDVDDPARKIAETPERAYKEKYDSYRDIIVHGNHRAYLKISPQDLASKRLGIRAVVKNNDQGARDKYQIRGSVEDPVSDHQLYKPKKTFTFAFVPLRVGSEENNSSVAYGNLSGQKEFIRKIFPAPIKFVEKSPMFIAKPRFSTHNMYLGRILRELDRTQKLFSNKYDLYIGMTPPGFLGAAGLQDSGMFGMNWSFLGARHGAVLIDSSKVLPHTTLHEFIHTLGLSDVYPEDGDQLLSANGHDGRPINNVAGVSPANEQLMYDSASAPWPTDGEYNALLEYATEPAAGKKSLRSSRSGFSLNSAPEVILLSGSIEDARSYTRKVYVDPIIKHSGAPDESSDYNDKGYVIQTLDSAGEILSQYFFSDYEYNGKYYASFIANLPAANVQVIEIGKQDRGSITQIFKRYEYSAHAPVVSLTGPGAASLVGDFMITWEASDADNDALRSEVQVSSDGGSTWDTIAADIPDQAGGEYSYAVKADAFPKDGAYKFKVIVTDGMYVTEAVSDKEYTIIGYEQKPMLGPLTTEATVQVKAGTQAAAAYFELVNEGIAELSVEFVVGDDTFISPLFIKEHTIYPGQNRIISVPLNLPAGEAEDTFTGTITLQTNDPDKAATDLEINIEYVEDALLPELAYLSTTPADFTKSASAAELQVTFDAYAAAGQSGLEATIIIENQNDDDIPVLRELMIENHHNPGVYTCLWEHDGLSAGDYGVYIGLKDTQADPNLERVRADGEYDFTFEIKAPNSPPYFVEPAAYENDLGIVERGDKITIPYEVSDPDGDALEIEVYSNLSEHGLELEEDSANSGSIEWTANRSGAHSIYLTATDSSGNSAEVVFTLAELLDLNLFTMDLSANSGEIGQVYGSGLYNSGEYVIAEAVPEDTYKFTGWTEEEAVVSTDPVYIFKAANDRELVANFEEETEIGSYVTDEEVIITGFDLGFLKDLVIPDEIDGYPVTGVSDAAFYSFRYAEKKIESLSLPDTLTSIAANAFRLNQLTEVNIPAGVSTIGAYAFANNEGLVKVVILNPDAVIGEDAFVECASALVIHGVTGSTAHTYAAANDIDFEAIAAPETYAVTLSGAGTDALGAGDYAENDTVTINAGTRAGYTFDGWASADVTFANATAQTTTFTMPAKNVTVTATWKTEEPGPGSGGDDTGGSEEGDDPGSGGGGDDSGSSGGSNDSSSPPNPTPPNTPPLVDTNPSNAVITSGTINKETVTTPEGKTLETFTVQNTAASQIQQAREEGKSSVEFNIASSQTAVTDITIPTTVLESAAGMNVAVSTPHATLELPAALVDALAASGQNLNLTVTRGEAMADPEGGTVLGTTTEITSDIVGETQVSIPLEGISIPADPSERADFLNSLAVFTYHSDGETELISGEIIYDTNGNPVSIRFPVDKFSTFAIVRLSQRNVALSIGSPAASLNSLPVTLDAPAYVEPGSNRTLVPLRFIGEALGAKVEWLPATRQVRIKDGEQEILLTIDSQLALKNGQSVQIDCAPMVVPPGRTFLPLRFIGEALGAEVTYDDATKGITIAREYGK